MKNINLRIKSDGTVWVSKNKTVPQKVVEDFMNDKADFILKALYKFENAPPKKTEQFFSETEIREVINKLCREVYPEFEKKGVCYPQIKFRKMVSCWGNCRASRGILTFNTSLMYAPYLCIKYVVIHEFTHFLQPNHSRLFYEELEKVMPDWKEHRRKLKEINIRF